MGKTPIEAAIAGTNAEPVSKDELKAALAVVVGLIGQCKLVITSDKAISSKGIDETLRYLQRLRVEEKRLAREVAK